jgi:23S rRNA (pseudouridine1915-N3)-methyltransferase
MRIRLAAVGTGMPHWVAAGFEEYARRLSGGWRLDLLEVPPAKRSRGTPPEQARVAEADRLERALPAGTLRVALDERGEAWDTPGLARQLERWSASGETLGLLVGGADGLHPRLREASTRVWSLSRLTLPHMLVRVVVAEQLYRAWSIITGHPYHRGG